MKYRRNHLLILVFLLSSIVSGLLLSDFQRSIMTDMLIAGMFALSANLLLGTAGMVTFGHAAYYGAGAYTVAIGTTRLGVAPELALLAAPIVSGLLATFLGWLCVRRSNLYFSILTLAFGQLLYVLVLQGGEVTGGDNGILGVPVPAIISNELSFMLFTLLVTALILLLLHWLSTTPLFLSLRALRNNPERAAFLGINKRTEQLKVFVLAGALAGLAGGLMTLHLRIASVDMLFWTTSAEPLLGSLLGGMYVLWGPLFGGALLAVIEVLLLRVTVFWPLILGTLTIISVLIAPEGILGTQWRKWRRHLWHS